MTYPKQLFKKGGPFGNPGRTYSVAGAADSAEEADLKAKGWAASVDEAYGKKGRAPTPSPTPAPVAIDEISAPTRAELEAKAEELGIGFNKRTKDETLAERIAEALS